VDLKLMGEEIRCDGNPLCMRDRIVGGRPDKARDFEVFTKPVLQRDAANNLI